MSFQTSYPPKPFGKPMGVLAIITSCTLKNIGHNFPLHTEGGNARADTAWNKFP